MPLRASEEALVTARRTPVPSWTFWKVSVASPFRVSCAVCRAARWAVQEQAALAAATDYNGTADVRHVPREIVVMAGE